MQIRYSVAGIFSATNGLTPVAIEVADLNGDAHADLVVANQDSDNVSVILGNGTRTLPAHTTYTVGDAPSSLRVASINSDTDAHLDIVVTNRDSDNLELLFGDGGGA